MNLITPQKIAAVMALSPLPRSLAELDDMVRRGLPISALHAGVGHAARTPEERRRLLFRIIPEATFKRRQDRLMPDESEKTERLARVYATALHAWDDEADAREFLNTPHPLLDERAPLDVAMTELGARRVEELLWQLFYGLPAGYRTSALRTAAGWSGTAPLSLFPYMKNELLPSTFKRAVPISEDKAFIAASQAIS